MANIGVSTEQLSLQARLEQLEAAIGGCHELVSKMSPQPEAQETPVVGGAEAAGERCMQDIIRLQTRLEALAVRVGVL